ncbi:MAG: 4-hydroxy-tetrahydrodipicolinate reductase [Candidatus Omnitrophota bacterium]
MIKLGVSGALGKMGASILSLAAQDKDFKVILALERLSHPQIGEKAVDVEVVSDHEMIKDVDVLVDFTAPEATLINIEYCLKFKKAVVVGTTGFLQEQKDRINAASKKIPIVFSPNMSIGVNLLFQLVREAAVQLPSEYKINMTEAHHVHKKDAPSGTAKFLAQIVREERGDVDVDIKSIREGEIVGDHEVVFESPWDTLVLRHCAKTRDIFAKGALEAAKFIVKKKTGLFGMADVLKEMK